MFSALKDLIVAFFTLPPEKRVKIIFYFFQTLFSIMFTSIIYEVFMGKYQILNVTDYQGIFDFIVKGRGLICLFFLFASWIIFYDLGYWLVKWLNQKIVISLYNAIINWYKKNIGNRSDGETYSQVIDKHLESVGAIKIIEGVKKRGVHYDSFTKMKSKMDNVVSEQRYKFPYLVLALIFQFNIIYFHYLENEINSNFLDIIIVFVFIFYLLSFFLTVVTLEGLKKMFEFTEKKLSEAEA